MNNEKKQKLLIIDDEKLNIIALAQLLKTDYEVIVAVSGEAGIEEAQKQLPDIILLDVLMPDLNGYDVIERLKASEVTADIPVIFVTGMEKEADEEKGLSLGAVDYITKPFRKAILEKRIKTHIALAEYVRKDKAGLIKDC